MLKNNLEYYRKQAGLTQQELADKAGVFQTEISRVEKGATDLLGHRWMLIAKALGCTLDELIG